MPHLDLDVLGMRPLGNQETRIRMPQIMQPHMPRNAGLPQGPRETAVRQVVRIEWLSVAATEDQGPMPVLGEALERSRERGRHVDGVPHRPYRASTHHRYEHTPRIAAPSVTRNHR